MKFLALVLTACCVCCIAQQRDLGRIPPSDPVLSSFAVSGQSALQTLVELSHHANVSLGIIMDDDHLCKAQITYSGNNVPLSTVVNSIVAQVPGYKWDLPENSSPFMIGPVSPRPVTEHFLGLVDKRYGPIKANLQTLTTALWVHIRYILYPKEGTAGDILSSPNDPIFAVYEENATVEKILNHIAIASRGTWILKPLPPKLTDLGTNMPFVVLPSSIQSAPHLTNLCLP